METQEEVNKFVNEIENMKINSEEDAVNALRAIVKLYHEVGDFVIDDEKIEEIEGICESKIESPKNVFINIMYPDRVKEHNKSGELLAFIENAVLETGKHKEKFFAYLELENVEERYFNSSCRLFGQNMVNEFEIKDGGLKKEYENWIKDMPEKYIDYITHSTLRTKVLMELYDDSLSVDDLSKKINVPSQELYDIIGNLEERRYVKSIKYRTGKMYKIQLKGLKVIHQLKLNNQINNN